MRIRGLGLIHRGQRLDDRWLFGGRKGTISFIDMVLVSPSCVLYYKQQTIKKPKSVEI